jgi:hypothetical protein
VKGVRFTKAELELLRALLCLITPNSPKADWKARNSLLAKLEAAVEAPKGVQVQPVEDALVAAAHGKVLKLEGGHAMASRRCTDAKVTPEDAKLVGGWMARQPWLTGPMTLLDVLNKWYQWLPKARATQPPPALQAGLGTNGTGQGPAQAGPAPKVGRTPQGFR